MAGGRISFLGELGSVARYWGVLPAMCFCWPASFCGFGGASGIGWGGGLWAMDSGAVMFLGHCRPTCSLAVVGWTIVFLRALGVVRFFFFFLVTLFRVEFYYP